jgi:D-aminopeptidase
MNMFRLISILLLCFTLGFPCGRENRPRVAELGLKIGVLPAGSYNAITDVKGVKVGHVTLVKDQEIRTGVTVILPHGGNLFQLKVPAAIYVANGFGKLAGFTQVNELGTIETPIVLTNTLSVPIAADALIDHTLSFKENKGVRSVNPVVGETNDGSLNDIAGRHVKKGDVLAAIARAKSGPVREGAVGAGTGTVCFGFKGGIGTASRVLPANLGGYTVGVLVQSNFGGVLQIAGVPVGRELNRYYLGGRISQTPDGSCMMVVATDAPLSSRNLKRLARRAMLGLARTGGISSNGSGDYVIAFSTATRLRVPYRMDSPLLKREVLHNDAMSPLFMAVIEATEEAILNSLFQGENMTGRDGKIVQALPLKKVMAILKKYARVDK